MISNHQKELDFPLIKTKISIPRYPDNIVSRRQQIEQINTGISVPLVVISAPAGFGKTNLLIEWALQSKFSIAWLTAGQEDNDFIRFFRYLTSALQEITPSLGQEILDFIHPPNDQVLELGLTLLLNEISTLPNDIALIIDDFHLIRNAKIYQTLDFLLKHASPNFHLILASRHEIPLDITSLRAKGRITELGADDLRFTEEEISQFFLQTLGLQLPPKTVKTLEEQTSGWITALKLIAISIRNKPEPLKLLSSFQGDAHYLSDFLSKEVFYHQSEDVQQFLLRSSILDDLTGPLCEAVTGLDLPPGYGFEMLNLLADANLFLSPIDPQHQWYRYHPLFADFLRHVQNKNTPEDIPDLYKRAALWFEKQNNPGQAFQYALASEDGEWAAQFIEPHIQTMIKTGDIYSIPHWIGKLPADVVHKHPGLSLAFIWGSIGRYQLDNAQYWLEDLEQSIHNIKSQQKETLNELSQEETQRHKNLLGGLAICRSTLAIINGDAKQAYEYSRKAEKYLPEDNPFILSLLTLEDSLYTIFKGNTTEAIEILSKTARLARIANNLLVLVVANCKIAEMQILQGHLSQAMATLQKIQLATIGPDGSPLPLSSIVDIEIGEILRERNQLDLAKEYFEQGIKFTKDWWSLSRLNGTVSLARVLQSQGNISEAKDLVNKANKLALSTESNHWDDLITSAVAVRLALQRNDIAEALHWWEKINLPENSKTSLLENFPYQVSEYILITQARFNYVIGKANNKPNKLQQALEILEIVLSKAQEYARVTSQIEIKLLEALIWKELDCLDNAIPAMLNALALGEPEDYQRIFLDEGQAIANLLNHCYNAQNNAGISLPTPKYINQLREEINLAPKTNPHPSEHQNKPISVKLENGFLVNLSPREIEVLSLIADGKSNQEISTQLYISLNTVKRHAYNIYRKLEVQKRTQAITKARQLKIIP